MRNILTTFFTLALVCGSAFAQSDFKKPQKSGYFFVAPGGLSVNQDSLSQWSFQIGGGFEGFTYRGLGLWVDGGGLGVGSTGSARRWTGMISTGAIYNFQRSAEQKICPFIAAGFTAIPEFDSAGAGYNVGGGVNYWFARRFGLKMDFRFHSRPGKLRTYDDVQGLIGIAVR